MTNLMKYHNFCFQKFGNVLQNLPSAAVAIGALRVKTSFNYDYNVSMISNRKYIYRRVHLVNSRLKFNQRTNKYMYEIFAFSIIIAYIHMLNASIPVQKKENTRRVSSDIKFTRQCFENAC